LKIALTSGYRECFWGRDWFNAKQLGGSETIMVELAASLAMLGHEITVRLPYPLGARDILHRDVRWVGADAAVGRYDLLFSFDDFEVGDHADRTILVACRSDPPRHRDFDQRIYLSKTHAELVGDPDAPHIGGGVWLDAYADPLPAVSRVPRRVIYTSSPDRGGHHAATIGKDFDYVATYRGANELDRGDLRRLQRTAMVQIHPCDPRRPSEFYGLSILEAMAAGTPCVISDADALPELWSAAAIVLPRPIDYGEWWQQIDELMDDRDLWADASVAGLTVASEYDWLAQAKRYLEAADGRSEFHHPERGTRQAGHLRAVVGLR
jgi:hypothetical protein